MSVWWCRWCLLCVCVCVCVCVWCVSLAAHPKEAIDYRSTLQSTLQPSNSPSYHHIDDGGHRTYISGLGDRLANYGKSRCCYCVARSLSRSLSLSLSLSLSRSQLQSTSPDDQILLLLSLLLPLVFVISYEQGSQRYLTSSYSPVDIRDIARTLEPFLISKQTPVHPMPLIR